MKTALPEYDVLTCQEKSYDEIRRKLIDGEIPQGSKLVARKLAKEFGFSYIPVRDSLMKLQSEGLVVSIPRWGFMAKKYSSRDVKELYEMREAVECQAVRMLAINYKTVDMTVCLKSFEELDEINLNGQEMDIKEFISAERQIDEKFHRGILAATGNRRFEDVWSNLHFQNICMVPSDSNDKARDLNITLEHHKQILDAIMGGDVDLAEGTMRKHISSAKVNLLEYYLER
ncbi:MAG: GntR family transcriptional regulator [Sedimentisphaeraceae bacterium JB056]